jgi:hypothetical protein
LARLLRSTARGAVSLERREHDANGALLSTFTRPWSDGTMGMRLSPGERVEKLAALVPLPRVHLVRYGGCLAPHRPRRGVLIPTPRQHGVDEAETDTGSPRWRWARQLKGVFAGDMARCPWCQQGALRLIAALTHGAGIRQILQQRKRAADPPPIAPARARQEAFAWSSACPRLVWSGPVPEGSEGEVPCSRRLAFALRLPPTRPGWGESWLPGVMTP